MRVGTVFCSIEDGEGTFVPNPSFLELNHITRADVLKDAIYELEELYKSALEEMHWAFVENKADND
jgi:hypothetical protein